MMYLIVYIIILIMNMILDKINNKVLEEIKSIIDNNNININKINNYKLLNEVIIEELINYRSNMTHIISNLENNLLVLVTLTKEKNIINWSIHVLTNLLYFFP